MKGKSFTGIGKRTIKADQLLIKLIRRFKDKSSKTTYVCNKQLRETKQKDAKYDVTKVKHEWGVKMKGCQNMFEFEIKLK